MLFSDLQEFEFDLPEDNIARFPASQRDESRLMVVDAGSGSIRIEPAFKNILGHLREGDVLVANHTKVSKRRVYLSRNDRIHESMFLEAENGVWKCKIRNSKKIKTGDVLLDHKTKSIRFTTIDKREEFVFVRPESFLSEEDFDRIGEIPIPPYLKREANSEDEIRYQTLFAKTPGSIAAPTAGLHFSERIFEELKLKKIGLYTLELSVGYGTFQPLTEENFLRKKLHREEFFLDDTTAEALTKAKREKRRIVSIGTTTLRALESCFHSEINSFQSGKGNTELFIQPEDVLKSCEGLITNFHLPGSSLLLLVSAFAGKRLLLDAYQKAISENFRFYSYGDAMLILRPEVSD
ncbi:tRNA preQ1(34) S-adenosylmethionine ribosyltransferase-isomerase QueA [Leptospira gomenensis]|uniref:S-adenosylmethionine:tRNA ribosyltransferase-isomerase n=1 Tax=Leptospira gomenensis TaxID=2484974 RepID=A0A5F1YAR5_9LEPT|nr:tRNA preQ1(34) S-adenosylmethionine ribosyltransferase-isomerase QueA [Leptospira gomenensis]TGK33860.1 tRNA preQ1(34) S-adenosylmethionine ribosyltransferase-isomerase QueA [Leptospira gomenensis]TGK36315.1 tRNA preQ1(34) S-adenosylmethionine ribosyltransferase-isomerase QueA [Leptospira gomenensis]TGK52085.1 tRNA preQ1(34) S-adenosylmethionine ribosyltransferase-isomerase QueA [Leptospira gomenensis]TGK59866.1 tRNA preQ1(34) S-adenosylmethionine ribosyltransferase-isomerase QueA [Leptospir